LEILHEVEDNVGDKPPMDIFQVLESGMVRIARRTDNDKILEELSKSPNSTVCLAVIGNHHISRSTLDRLTRHDSKQVQEKATRQIEKMIGVNEFVIPKVS
jgi:hypothetical protein